MVGALRGNEIQQMYVCARLIEALKKLEAKGALTAGKEIFSNSSVNHASMNIGKRFWPTDNTDINRMFPGYSLGKPHSALPPACLSKYRAINMVCN